MTRIIHMADLHFGKPCRDSRLTPDAQNAVELARFIAFRDALQNARAKGYDAALIAGDLFDRVHVPPAALTQVLNTIRNAAPLPVCIIPGNHDPAILESPYIGPSWPHNSDVFHNSTPDWTALPNNAGTIYASGWDRKEMRVNPIIGPHKCPLDAPQPHIVMAHGSELNTQPRDWKSYGAFYAHQLLQFRPKYIALGHLHWWTEGTLNGNIPYVYPGAFASTGFDETGPRYYADVTLTDAGVTVTRRRTGAHEFYEAVLHGHQIESAQALTDSIIKIAPRPEPGRIQLVRIVGALRPQVRDQIRTVHGLLKGEFEHLIIEDLTVAAAGGDDAPAAAGRAQRFEEAIDILLQNESDDSRRALLEKIKTHGHTRWTDEDQPGRGVLYQ